MANLVWLQDEDVNSVIGGFTMIELMIVVTKIPLLLKLPTAKTTTPSTSSLAPSGSSTVGGSTATLSTEPQAGTNQLAVAA